MGRGYGLKCAICFPGIPPNKASSECANRLNSVITKVAAQTEPGFRYYLARALRDGCTPDEVIDAILMAFPMLGLTKIIWATDILLDMDIPGFRPENLGAEASWHDVAALDDIAMEEAVYLEADGRNLFVYFVYRTEQEIRVYDSRCPHQVTDIPHLALEGKRLTCPKHEWAFDIETGTCVAKGKRPLTQFKHKAEDGRLLVHWRSVR
ncbi:MAG: Rieske 2Fe-2S domain-containing protein [Chloroflexi bacterium]|nr:Rieske 2Fe-2S domain-containing protein [Chloroflexota bacterium]